MCVWFVWLSICLRNCARVCVFFFSNTQAVKSNTKYNNAYRISREQGKSEKKLFFFQKHKTYVYYVYYVLDIITLSQSEIQDYNICINIYCT